MRIHSSYVSSIKTLSNLCLHTDSLERFLRIIDQVVQILQRPVFSKLHHQLRDSIEILGIVQSIHLVQELTIPNDQGLYFLQRVAWQRSAGRISLACYSILRHLRWMDKLGFIALGKIGCASVGNASLLRLLIDSSYIFYRLSIAAEGIRIRSKGRVVVSLGKVCVVAAMLALSVWKIQKLICHLGLLGLNLLLDCYLLKQRLSHV